MKTVSTEEFLRKDICFDSLDFSPAAWTETKTFSGFDKVPRPTSAFFLAIRDIKAIFKQNNGERVVAKKGDIVYIPEGITYRAQFECSAKDNLIDSYTMNIRFFEGDEDIVLSNKIKIIAKDPSDRFELIFRELGESLHSEALGAESRNYPIKVKAEAYSFIFAMLNEAVKEKESYYPIYKGVDLIASEWNKNEKIEKYANICGVSEGYFYRLFRERYGMTPVEYRNRIRISHAKSMLRNTEMSIGKIAAFVGFEDPLYFCRVFKKHIGISPKYFRKG